MFISIIVMHGRGLSRDWETSRLFECISAMKKGSPGSYYAETSDEALTQKAVPGEPNERLSLYRIRRPQETYQLLHQDRRGSGGRTGPLGCATFDAARVGCGANPSLARAMEATLFSDGFTTP